MQAVWERQLLLQIGTTLATAKFCNRRQAAHLWVQERARRGPIEKLHPIARFKLETRTVTNPEVWLVERAD